MDENQIKLFQSKDTDNWATPKDLFMELNKEFNFNYDPCPINSLINGLKVDWRGRVFCNPPYSNVGDFLLKGRDELKKGNVELIVYLVFVNTDTNWFHSFIKDKAEIRFLKGRLKFSKYDQKGYIVKDKNSAMRPSMLCIFRAKDPDPQ